MKRKGKKSYYYKFLTSFLIVLLVPMLTIILIFFQAQKTVKEQIVSSSSSSLSQFFLHVDSIIGVAADTSQSIAFDSQYSVLSRQFISQPMKRAYYIWMLREHLSNYQKEEFQDIFVYYPGNDSVISLTSSGSDLENYYKNGYGREGVSKDEMYQIANSPYQKPVLYSMNGTGKDSYQCVAMRMGISREKNQEYVVVIVLKQDATQKLLREMSGKDEIGDFLILNRSGEIIFNSSGDIVSYAGDIYRETDEIYEYSVDGTDYMLLSRASEELDAAYVYAMPAEYFWNELYNIYVIFLVGLVGSVVLGVLVVYRQTNTVYRPFGQIMGRLQEKTVSKWDAGSSNELEFIERIFNSETEEKYKLHVALKQGKEVKRNEFIRSLFNDRITVSSVADDIFAENEIDLCSNHFCVCVVQTVGTKDMETELMSFILQNVLTELLGDRHRSYIVSLTGDRYGVLVNLGSKEGFEDVVSMLEQEAKFLNEHFHMEVTGGVSSVQEGLHGISDAFREAALALEYSYLLGSGIIIRYADVADRQFRPSQVDKLRQLVINFLRGKNCGESQALEVVDECLKSYGIDREASLDMVECFKFETINTFHFILHQEGYWNQERKEMVMELIGSPSLAVFRQKFAELLTEIARKHQENAVETDICARARDYIEAHFGDSQLSLGGLSDILGLTPIYLSKLFKDKYQYSIPDYIARVRISHAKELLANTSDSIQSIAIDTGFMESSSFIRVFKKLEGITPGGYRKLVDR